MGVDLFDFQLDDFNLRELSNGHTARSDVGEAAILDPSADEIGVLMPRCDAGARNVVMGGPSDGSNAGDKSHGLRQLHEFDLKSIKTIEL